MASTSGGHTEIINRNINSLKDNMVSMQTVMSSVSTQLSSVFSNLTNSFVESLGLANQGMEGFASGMIKTVTKLISMMLAQSISQAIAGATASGAATGPGAVFATPGFIATAVGGVMSAFAAIPKFADGGIVYGETLGLMGEYSGVRSNPEIIAPLDKLKNLIGDGGGSNVNITGEFRLRNTELVAAVERGVSHRSRRGA